MNAFAPLDAFDYSMLDQTNIGWNAADVPVVSVVPKLPDNAVLQQQLQRVLHIVNGEHFAGAERVQMHLGRCLPQFGFRADFACLVPGKFHDQFDLQQSQSRAFPMNHRFDVGVAGRIVRAVKNEGYVGVHAHTPRSAMIGSLVAKRLRVPLIYHVHSPVARDSAKQFSNTINSWVERCSLRNVAHLITVSNSLRMQVIEDGYDQRRVTVIHNGVPSVRTDRKQIPVVGGRWVVGMVALIRPRKGLEVALRALQAVRAAGHDLVLRCIGPFETEAYEQTIRDLINQLDVRDAVEFTGFTKDVTGELDKLDAMVLPSLYGEGMPMVVLEAMAVGLPVVATKVEGTPEAIEHGEQGLLAEANNPGSLAESLIELMTGKFDWQEMSHSAIRRHAECFSDLAMADKTADVYRRVLGA